MKKGSWRGAAPIHCVYPDRGTCQPFVQVSAQEGLCACICFAGRQTCLFCIWFDATDEEWVGSTKCGHQGMERILKSRKTKPKGSVTIGGKGATFDAIGSSCILPIPNVLRLPKHQQCRRSLPVQTTPTELVYCNAVLTWTSLFSELYSWCELFLQVSQTLNIGNLNCETNRRFADNLGAEIHTCKIPPVRFSWNCHYISKRCGLKGHIHSAETPNQHGRSKNLKNFIYSGNYYFPLPPWSVLASHISHQREILGAVALLFFRTTTFLHISSAGHKTRMNDSSWLQALLYPSAPPQKPAAVLENILPWTGNWQSVCASGCPSSVSLHCTGCRLFQKGHRWSPA